MSAVPPAPTFLSLEAPVVSPAEQAARLAALREAVAVGIADIEAGRYTEFRDAKSLRTHIDAIAKRVRDKHA